MILFAALFAMLLGFFAKFSAIVDSIPQGVLGGVTIILYTLISITGIRIWVVNKVDFNGMLNTKKKINNQLFILWRRHSKYICGRFACDPCNCHAKAYTSQ